MNSHPINKCKTSVTNKNIFLWALYNFSNTPLTAAMGGLFLAQWIIIDNKIDDIWYGGTFTLATTLLLITSPFFGAWSDKVGKRMPFLKWTTFAMIGFGLALGFISISSLERIPKIALALVIFFFLQYFYQISLIFHNALLDKISTPQTRGHISGIGQALEEISWLVSNVLLIPFSIGAITLLGQAGRGQVFIPATLILISLGLPMLIWFREPNNNTGIVDNAATAISPKTNFKEIYKETIAGFKNLIKNDKNVTVFLIAFMFVSDALLTASLYFAIYLDKIFKITDVQKLQIVVVLEIVSMTSAYFVGRLGDKFGLKKLMILACINLTLVYTLVGLTSSLTLLYILAAFIGFGYGGFYTTSRALLVKISPRNRLGEYFGFFSTFQKFASIIGPVTWGGVLLLFKSYGDVSYRAGILSLCVLMAAGTVILTKVTESPNTTTDLKFLK